MYRPLHVVVVHSDVGLLSMLYERLSREGCRVATYTSPWAATSYIQLDQPDVILSSIDFPVLQGLSLVKRFKETAPEARMIVLTPSEPWAWMEDALHAGADALVPEGAPAADLLRLLHDIVEEPHVSRMS